MTDNVVKLRTEEDKKLDDAVPERDGPRIYRITRAIDMLNAYDLVEVEDYLNRRVARHREALGETYDKKRAHAKVRLAERQEAERRQKKEFEKKYYKKELERVRQRLEELQNTDGE